MDIKETTHLTTQGFASCHCGLFPQFSTTLLKKSEKGEMSLKFMDKKRDHTPDHLPNHPPPTIHLLSSACPVHNFFCPSFSLETLLNQTIIKMKLILSEMLVSKKNCKHLLDESSVWSWISFLGLSGAQGGLDGG